MKRMPTCSIPGDDDADDRDFGFDDDLGVYPQPTLGG